MTIWFFAKLQFNVPKVVKPVDAYLRPPGCGGAWLSVAKNAASRASFAAPSPLSDKRRTYQ